METLSFQQMEGILPLFSILCLCKVKSLGFGLLVGLNKTFEAVTSLSLDIL